MGCMNGRTKVYYSKMDTWPSLITLNPSTTIVPPINILHEWITTHSGVIAMLLPAEQKISGDNFRTLARLLAEKSMVRYSAIQAARDLLLR